MLCSLVAAVVLVGVGTGRAHAFSPRPTAAAGAPTVSIVIPAAGAVLAGAGGARATIAAAASPGVTGVDFYAFGGGVFARNLGAATLGTSGWTREIDTTRLSDGPILVVAIARDGAGQVAVSGLVTATVKNTDLAVQLSAPAVGATVAGATALRAVAGPTAITRVDYRLTGGPGFPPAVVDRLIGTSTSGGTWVATWDATTVADGAYSLTVTATRYDGTSITAPPRAVRVENAPLRVGVTAPTVGGNLTGLAVPLTATAKGGDGVRTVQFAVDGRTVGFAAREAGSYRYDWNSGSVLNGVHTLTATVTDGAGTVVTGDPVAVTTTNTVQILAQELGILTPYAPPGVPPIVNRTTTPFDVFSADLGVAWDDGAGHVLLAFGDTKGRGWKGPATPGGTNWRWNALARSSDTTLADGAAIDGWSADAAGKAQQILLRDPTLTNEVTATPTAGISVGGRQFLYYVSQRRNNADTNYGGFAYSDDDGLTWTRVPNAVWRQNATGTDPFQYGSLTAPGDGYVYLLGTQAYRRSGVTVARAPVASILDKTAWTYFDGSSWQPDESAAVEVIPPKVGEASVWFSSTLQQWLFLYTDPDRGVLMRKAPTLTGPWGPVTPLVTIADYGAVYGGFVHPWSSGHDLYFFVSIYGPYSVYLFHTTI